MRIILKLRKQTKKYITKKAVERLIEEARKKHSPYTLSNYIKALRLFFVHYLKMPEYVEDLRWPKTPLRFIQLPTRDQLRGAFETLQDDLEKAIFLFYVTTGLRRSEVLELKLSDVLFELRAVIPKHSTETKRSGITFYNEEAEFWLKKYLQKREDSNEKLFVISDKKFRRIWRTATKAAGIKITPQILRKWHAVQLRMLGVPDSFIDIFQGRAPRSVLARYYTPVGVQELKQVYDRAGLKILD